MKQTKDEASTNDPSEVVPRGVCDGDIFWFDVFFESHSFYRLHNTYSAVCFTYSHGGVKLHKPDRKAT